MIIPNYGINWRHKLPRMSLFLWHVMAIHNPRFRKIQVAPYNKPPRPKRKLEQRKR